MSKAIDNPTRNKHLLLKITNSTSYSREYKRMDSLFLCRLHQNSCGLRPEFL